MRTKVKWFFLALAFLIVLYGLRLIVSRLFLEESRLEIILTYNVRNYTVEAIESVLKEEGVPHKEILLRVLISTDPQRIAYEKPAVIIPDSSAVRIHPDMLRWFSEYVRNGGSILLIYDPGIKNHAGAYLKEPLFTSLLGAKYSLYDELRDKSYSLGFIKVVDEKLLKHITPGKVDKDLKLIKGYIYGDLVYPYAKSQLEREDIKVLAQVEDKEDHTPYPALFYRKYGRGYVFFSALPLGHLKAYADDFITRTTLRFFLFNVLKIPHILNVPRGRGGIVINWHIDANSDWNFLPMMIEKGYVRKGIEYSFHITAGSFRDKPGDGLGFDACGKGRKLVEMIIPYGVIGSHGGWAHNWFSENIEEGNFGKAEIEEYIKKNNKCLESITGYKIKEYSAPNGVHPQPGTTEVLEKLGVVAYYYTGDSGSSPNRTFVGGSMVSDEVIAFPISPLENSASLYEMYLRGVSEKEVSKFLKDLADFTARTRQIRLFYSHPYDLGLYPEAILNAIDYIDRMKRSNKIEVRSMSYFADFFLRFLKTKYSFSFNDRGLSVKLENPKGIKFITVGVPKDRYDISKYKNSAIYGVLEDDDYYYVYPRIEAFTDRLEFGFR